METVAKHGGARKGSGRKTAPHTIEAAKAREHLVERIAKEVDALLEKYLELAFKGDQKAIEYLLNQLVGKPRETLDLKADVKFSLRELAKRADELEHGA